MLFFEWDEEPNVDALIVWSFVCYLIQFHSQPVQKDMGVINMHLQPQFGDSKLSETFGRTKFAAHVHVNQWPV